MSIFLSLINSLVSWRWLQLSELELVQHMESFLDLAFGLSFRHIVKCKHFVLRISQILMDLWIRLFVKLVVNIVVRFQYDLFTHNCYQFQLMFSLYQHLRFSILIDQSHQSMNWKLDFDFKMKASCLPFYFLTVQNQYSILHYESSFDYYFTQLLLFHFCFLYLT